MASSSHGGDEGRELPMVLVLGASLSASVSVYVSVSVSVSDSTALWNAADSMGSESDREGGGDMGDDAEVPELLLVEGVEDDRCVCG